MAFLFRCHYLPRLLYRHRNSLFHTKWSKANLSCKNYTKSKFCCESV